MGSGESGALTGLKLRWPAVAIGFLNDPPAGLPRIDTSLPAGCAYWKHASEGHAFYTLPEDHYNCPVGAFTHGVELPPRQAEELNSLVGTMIELKYLSSDEIPAIPHRRTPARVMAYAPLDRATFRPDVVIIRGTARQVMVASEAVRAAGIFESASAMGRPACAMIPKAIDSAQGVASLGCIGNRVYTGLSDDELYLAVPGESLQHVLEKLETIIAANAALEQFHLQRAAS